MNKNIKTKILELFQTAKFNEPLKNHCSFHIGGPADAFIEIKTLDKKNLALLKSILKFLKSNKIPFFILGSGTNTLFHDKGFRGMVIRITANNIKFEPKKVTVEAGVILQTLITKTKQKGFNNLTQLTGIPGTIGGAIRGNAGANGLEIKDVLIKAEILNPRTGEIRTASHSSLKLSYRKSILKKTKELILKAEFKLSKIPKNKLSAEKLNLKRIKTQQYGLSAGSFFKNPDYEKMKKDPKIPKITKAIPSGKFKAGYLIEQCGLKGKKIGGAKISERHANFIQKLPDSKTATPQKDVLALADLAKKEVFKKFKIKLEEEVEIVPEKPNKNPTIKPLRVNKNKF